MNRYHTETPRMAFGIVAIALTALTIALAVVAPARFDSRSADTGVLAAATRNAQVPIEVAIVPSSIEVIGIRSPDLASMQPHVAPGTAKPQG